MVADLSAGLGYLVVAGWQEILDSISHLHAFSRELSAIPIRRVKSTASNRVRLGLPVASQV